MMQDNTPWRKPGSNVTGEEGVDLRALDPDSDPLGAARFEQQVMARIRARSGATPSRITPLVGVWSIARTLAIAVSIIAVVGLGALARIRRDEPRNPALPRTVAEAIGVPPAFLPGVTQVQP